MEHNIVSRILNLARDPNNRAMIVQDQGCLPGLVLFLDNRDPTVVDTAVEALVQLAECKENQPVMYSELGLVLSLTNLLANPLVGEHTHKRARRVIELISPQPSDWSVSREQKKSRAVTLQIRGLDDLSCRKQVEEQLLSVKGVVSFTFNMKDQRVEIRARQEVSVEAMCAAINATKIMSAAQVVRTEDGKEVVLSFGRGPAAADKENEHAVRKQLKYLDDDDDVAADTTKAVIRAEDAGKSAGWFSSIGNYLSKSLYW